MRCLRDYRFWLTAVGCVGVFLILWPMSVNGYTRPYCLWLFNGISVAGFGAAGYLTWTRDWTRDSIGTMLWGLVLSSIPHFIFALTSCGSCVCLGAAAVIAVWLVTHRNRLTEAE